MDFELLDLLNFAWVVLLFFINKSNEANKELKGIIKQQGTQIAELEKAQTSNVQESFVRDLCERLFDKQVEPVKSDLKEVVVHIDRAMREFDKQIHELALQLAKGSRGSVKND